MWLEIKSALTLLETDLMTSCFPAIQHHTPQASISCITLVGPQDTRLQISLPLAAGIQNIHGNRSVTPGRRQQNWKAPFCFYLYSSVNWQLGDSLTSIRLGCTFLPSFVSSFYLCRSQPRWRHFSHVGSPLQLILQLSGSIILKHSWLCSTFLNKMKHCYLLVFSPSYKNIPPLVCMLCKLRRISDS